MHASPSSPNTLFRCSFRGFAGDVFALLLTLVLAGPAFAQQAAVNPARVTQVVDNSVRTILKGNVHPLARPEYDKGPANASLPADRMQLVLQRSPGQEIALRQFLGSLQDTNSSQYRKWITPEQFGAQYGVSDADILTVSTWLASQGFKVNKVNKAHTIIEFSGSVGQLQTAFHTQIHSFAVNGEQHLANVSDPQIPAALAPVVAGLSSMNNFFPTPQHTKPQLGRYDKATRKLVPELTLGSASEGYFLYLVPGDAATIYDTPNAWNVNFKGTTSYTGTGVSIGIAGDSNIATSDVDDYRSLFGLPAATPTVVVDGNDPGVNGDVIEALLDLEVSGGLAPGATQTFYTAADTNLDAGLYLAINRALDDNAISVLNVSFGLCEAFQGTTGNLYINSLWEQAASQGITVTVSSGDAGSAACDNDNTQQQAQDGLQVNGLASTPFNIAVGGTDFDVLATDFTTYVSTTNSANFTSALGFIPEEPWNNSPNTNGLLSANTPFMDSNGDTNIVAAGGGASSCVLPQYDPSGNLIGCAPTEGAYTGWPKPSWQTGGTLNIPADGVRDLPDLSLFAANGAYGATWLVCYTVTESGQKISCAPDSTGEFEFFGVGGTSSSAPAFAGMLALISQSQSGARLGQANYVLYNLANQASLYTTAFHDTTVGNNSVYCVIGSPNCGTNLFETGYDTGLAYDQASGLGSLDLTQLIADWTKATFTPTTTTFTINGGTTPVSITHGQAVTLSATVAGAGGTPTGNVAVLSNANEQASTYNSNWLDTVTLGGGTTGPQSFTNLPGGTYTVWANYGGDITFAQSQSTPGIQVTVAKENSVLNLFGENGSGAPQTISGPYPYGTAFSLDAQPIGVSQVGSPNPAFATGTVTFADTAGPLPGSSSGAAAGVVAINSYGYAELPVYYWSTAAHSVSASYSGDNSLNASTAATPASFTITKAATSATVTSVPPSLGSGSFTVTTLITPNPLSNATAPTGAVTLTTNGKTIGTGTVSAVRDPNTGATLASVAITAMASALAAGANTITATYSGDANYTGSTGSVVVSVVAGLSISGTNISTIAEGASGTSTVTITPSAGFTGAVALSCSVAGPMGAVSIPTCSYNPTSVTIAGTTAATSTLTVATTSATTGGTYTVTIDAADTATGKITANSTVTAMVSLLNLTSTAATVSSPGQSGTSTITITPNNYTGTISLGCVLMSSPSGANGVDNPTCAVSPSTATIASAAPVTATATVATTAPAGTSGALAYPPTNRWSMAAGGAALACILFFGIPARRRSWRSMLGLLVVLSAMAGIGCGGGVTIPPNKPSVPGTSPGVYTFSVTATDTTTATTTGSTVFTVTVQ